MKKFQFLFLSFILSGFLINAAAKQIRVTTSTSGTSFSPSNFTAAVGDTINFVYGGFSSHTTTSTSVPAGAATWDAPLNSGNPSFRYIIKVSGNYAFKCTPHASMGMVGSFTVTPAASAAKITVVKATSVNNCTNTNSLQYQCTQSKPPYKVQLFRYGKAIGSVRTVNNTMPFTFSNLQPGSYFATARGNNGNDATAGKSATSALLPVPQGLRTSNVTSTAATINWNHFACVKFYTVQFRRKGVTTWTSRNTVGNKDLLRLTGLTANTMYEFRVASKDSANKITAASKFTAIGSFTTKAAALITLNSSSQAASAGKVKDLLIFPNPTGTSFTIQTNGLRFISAQLSNADGIVVWRASQNTISDNKSLTVNVSSLPTGTYFLQLIDINKKQRTEKIMVER